MLKMLEGNVANMHKEIEKFSREVKTRRKMLQTKCCKQKS